MRIVVDLQGAQSTGSRQRGIGRYSLALAKEMARQAGDHEIWIALNGLFPDTIEPLRAAFDGLVPQQRIVVWQACGPVAAIEPANHWRREAGERLREAFLGSVRPDVVHVSSLFEGLDDDALTSVGALENMLPTAVTLYDLIVLVRRDSYLANPMVESWYERKLGYLRRAQLWLAISESSRREGIERLDLPGEWVANVSAAADAMFRPVTPSGDEQAALRARYGLTRPFVMYTGGIDQRKNVEGLIGAYAKLSAPVRAGHQLAVVCSATEAAIDALRSLAVQVGLGRDDVVFTGFIPDTDMVALYNLCQAFVFPSWHEGFGLPALEAMSCGAAVIGANASSVPEVIGRPDALFDPHDGNDMATKLLTVLTDDAFRQQLKDHALTQAGKFSWGNTARRALEAFERLHAHNQATEAARVHTSAPRRIRLAYVSPLPPERSGIADYSADLLPELARHYDIDVVVNQPNVSDPWIRANTTIRSAGWFDQNADRYDRVLYQFGNSAFHQHMFGLLERHPGTVVLHDFFLSGVIAHTESVGYARDAWTTALYAAHGYHAVRDRFAAHDLVHVLWRYPANFAVLQQANGVIVHSHFSRELADKWYGEGYSADWALIPLLRARVAATDRAAMRASLSLGEEDFLVCSFGMVAATKLNHRLLTAWLASPLAQNSRCHLVFVGETDNGQYGAELLRSITQNAAANPIRLAGFAPPALYRKYMAAADAAVQLRALSRGETSATVLDCMKYGLPTIVNAHGAAVELPQDCVLQLPDEFSDVELQVALAQLWREPSLRQALGERARAWVRVHHHPLMVANRYRDAIERFAQRGPQSRIARLVGEIARLETSTPSSDTDWLTLAQCIAQNQSCEVRGPRQWLVDISESTSRGGKPGIEHVMRAMLLAWLHLPPDGFRVEPVYCDGEGTYRYARRSTTKLLEIDAPTLTDEPIETTAGDVLLMFDRFVHVSLERRRLYERMRERGIGVYFVVHELPPTQRREHLQQGVTEMFGACLEMVAAVADGAVCTSRMLADELAQWLNGAQPLRHRPFRVGWFHAGADVVAGLATGGVARGFDPALSRLRERRSLLAVGSLEPALEEDSALKPDATRPETWEDSARQLADVILKGRWHAQWPASLGNCHPHAQRASSQNAPVNVLSPQRDRSSSNVVESSANRDRKTVGLFFSLGDIARLVYGDNHEVNEGVLQTLRGALGKDFVETMADVRAVSMALDRQTFPTPMIVRFSQEDIRFAPINGIDCPVDRHDLSVSVPSASSGSWEPHLVACFRKVCRPGAVAFDIGANVGYHTLMLATLTGTEGKCYAFEPNSENCRLILLGCERNGLSNITLFPIALSDQPGWEYFSSHIGSNGGFVTQQFVSLHGHGTVVPVFVLDGLPLPKADLIKVDVEGAEYKVLKGGEALLSKSRPTIISEFSAEMTPRVSRVAPAHYLNWIAGMDYKLYILDKASCEPVAVDSISALLDGWGSSVRVEDLLFLPRERTQLVERI